MYHLKQRFGDRPASRLFATQAAEVHARVAAMNAMTYLAMPVSVCAGAAAAWRKRGRGRNSHRFIYAPTPID